MNLVAGLQTAGVMIVIVAICVLGWYLAIILLPLTIILIIGYVLYIMLSSDTTTYKPSDTDYPSERW